MLAWGLITWSIFAWSRRAWAASAGAYLMTSTVLRLIAEYTRAKADAAKRRIDSQ